jgi:C4-dicarboxylate transporter DctQ subunit
MAGFGAAYGGRTGIRVGVDYVVNKSTRAKRRALIITGISLGIIFTGVIAFFGARWVVFIYGTGQISPDLEWPLWIIYLAIPFGSGLMCYRFIQSLVKFLREGEVISAGPAADLREGALDNADMSVKEQAK